MHAAEIAFRIHVVPLTDVAVFEHGNIGESVNPVVRSCVEGLLFTV